MLLRRYILLVIIFQRENSVNPYRLKMMEEYIDRIASVNTRGYDGVNPPEPACR